MSEDSKQENSEVFPEGFKIDKYVVIKLLGHGGYGQIYAVQDTKTRKEYALKYETCCMNGRGLAVEEEILNILKPSKNFPEFIASGVHNGNKYMVIELLGPSLSNVRRQLQGRKYSPYSALFLSYYTLCCIEELHSHGIINRDIKPGNFLLRANWEYPICMIDFGLSTYYFDKKTRKHIEFQKNSNFIGTCKYASINSHENCVLSRRDDMISWFYSCIEFFAGHLPWPASKDKASTYIKKVSVQPETLLKKLPKFFEQIYRHIFNLEFYDKPDYGMIKSLFMQDLKASQYRLDWENIDPEIINRLSEVNFIARPPRPVVELRKNFVMPDSAEASNRSAQNSNESSGKDEDGGCCRI